MNIKLIINYLVVILLVISHGKLFSDELVMTESDFMKIVGKNHPVVKQANIQILKGQSNLLKSKGAFDPFLTTEYDNKTYLDKSYYEIINSGLKIPLWFGPDLNFSFQSSNGNYLNPQNLLPENGLLSAGIKIPLGQGLFIDYRRAAFKQAEIFDKLSSIEQIRILADLYINAIESYWNWAGNYKKLKISDDILNLAKNRYNGVKQSFLQGDIAAIDTLESYLQILNFEMNLQSVKYEFLNSGILLSNFLWDENLQPLEINENLIPFKELDLSIKSFDEIKYLVNNLDSLVNIHPEIEVYNYKLEQLHIERQLKSDYLKPKLDFKYDLLNDAFNLNSTDIHPESNFKIGVDFKMPLLLRNERGDLQLTDLKIEETILQAQNKRLEIKNKVNSYINEIEVLSSNFKLYSIALANYRRLLEAEQIKFNNGESSLFLLNSRENSLLNASIKQIDLYIKIKTKYADLSWMLGNLGKEQF
jgi:outer membrane protein TolC